MQRRAILLLVLLGVLALFYASVTRKSVPTISAGNKAQVQLLNRLDEQVLGTVGAEPEAADSDQDSSGD